MGAITGDLCHSDLTKLSNSVSQTLTAASSAAAFCFAPWYFLKCLVRTTLSNLFSTLWKNTSASANPLGNTSQRNLLKLAMTTLQSYEFSLNLNGEWSQKCSSW